jgi:hypothetical protein
MYICIHLYIYTYTYITNIYMYTYIFEHLYVYNIGLSEKEQLWLLHVADSNPINMQV